MDSETFAAYESGCTCWRLVDQYVGWDEQPTEMLGITIFTGGDAGWGKTARPALPI